MMADSTGLYTSTIDFVGDGVVRNEWEKEAQPN